MKFPLHSRILLVWILSVIATGTVVAQDSTAVSPVSDPLSEDLYSLETPRRAVSRHLFYLRPENYQPERSAGVISGDLSMEEKIELATSLRDIFDAKGYYVETDLIPDEAMFVDSVSGTARYNLFPKKFPLVYLTQNESGQWQYSETTVERIPYLYDEVIPAGSGFIRSLVPAIGNKEFLGMVVWKWVGLILILAICYGVYRILNLVFGWIFRRVLPRFTPKSYVDPKLIPPVARPLSVVMVLMLLRSYFMPMLLLPIDITDPLRRILAILMSIFGVIVFYRLVDVFASVFRNLASKTETTMDDQLIPLLSRGAKLVIIIFGLLFILDNLEVDVTALLAGVSIGGLALALAAQDTVKNFIGSISIFVDRPFVIGDFINAGDITGTILEVGVRTTTIRAAD